MSQFYYFKRYTEKIYRKHEFWIRPLFRALVALIIFIMVNTHFAYSSLAQNPLIVLFLSILCSMLPWTAISLLSAVLFLLNLHEASFEFTLVSAMIFLLIALLQTAFRARHGILLALVPFFFFLKLQYVLPAIVGLSCGLTTFVPLALGTTAYYFLVFVSENIEIAADSANIAEMANHYASIFTKFFENRTMFSMIFIMVMIMIVVYVIRNLPFEYSWHLGIITGMLSGALLLVLSSTTGSAEIDLPSHFLSLFFSFLLSFLYVLFLYGANYQVTERVRFEDDDYYYFVKAVPKFKTAEEEE